MADARRLMATLLAWCAVGIALSGCATTIDAGAVIAPEHPAEHSGFDLEVRSGVHFGTVGALLGARARIARRWLQVAGSLTGVVTLQPGGGPLFIDLRAGLALGTNKLGGLNGWVTSLSPFGELVVRWDFVWSQLSLGVGTEWSGIFEATGQPGADEPLVLLRLGVFFWSIPR